MSDEHAWRRRGATVWDKRGRQRDKEEQARERALEEERRQREEEQRKEMDMWRLREEQFEAQRRKDSPDQANWLLAEAGMSVSEVGSECLGYCNKMNSEAVAMALREVHHCARMPRQMRADTWMKI